MIDSSSKLLLIKLFFVVFILTTFSCSDDNVPKPHGLIRIDVPKYGYNIFDDPRFPFSFEYAEVAKIVVKDDSSNNWLNIDYPAFKGTVYFTYLSMDSSLSYYIDKSRDMAFKHISKANDIRTEILSYPKNKVHGHYYSIIGNDAASPINFLITDSTKNFVRASLYFDFAPSNDSLQPVIDAIDKDLRNMIRSFKWKNQ